MPKYVTSKKQDLIPKSNIIIIRNPNNNTSLIITSRSRISNGHQDIPDPLPSSVNRGDGPGHGHGSDGRGLIGRGLDDHIGRVLVGRAWLVGADGGPEPVLVGYVVDDSADSSFPLDGVAARDAAGPIAGLLVGAAAAVL